MQEAHDGKKKIIAAASHTFNAMERNWSTTEREAFAIKWAILKYDYFLNGCTFIIFTDHKFLIYLDQRKFNYAKIRRWQEEISSHRFVLEYIQGEMNVWADMLSRSRDINKTKCKPDNSAVGRTFRLRDMGLHIYVPSWCTRDIDNAQLT